MVEGVAAIRSRREKPELAKVRLEPLDRLAGDVQAEALLDELGKVGIRNLGLLRDRKEGFSHDRSGHGLRFEVTVSENLFRQRKILIGSPDLRGQAVEPIRIEPSHQGLGVAIACRQAILRQVLADVLLIILDLVESLRPGKAEDGFLPYQVLDGADGSFARASAGRQCRNGHRGSGGWFPRCLAKILFDFLDIRNIREKREALKRRLAVGDSDS